MGQNSGWWGYRYHNLPLPSFSRVLPQASMRWSYSVPQVDCECRPLYPNVYFNFQICLSVIQFCVHFRDTNVPSPLHAFAIRVGSSFVMAEGQLVPISRIVDHPLYGNSPASLYDYDITLIQLAVTLTYTDSIQPIPLPSLDQVFTFFLNWFLNVKQKTKVLI